MLWYPAFDTTPNPKLLIAPNVKATVCVLNKSEGLASTTSAGVKEIMKYLPCVYPWDRKTYRHLSFPSVSPIHLYNFILLRVTELISSHMVHPQTVGLSITGPCTDIILPHIQIYFTFRFSLKLNKVSSHNTGLFVYQLVLALSLLLHLLNNYLTHMPRVSSSPILQSPDGVVFSN